jgi:hypothetical protein
MNLQKPDKHESARGRGSITVRFNVEHIFPVSDAISNTFITSGPRLVEDLARIGIVANVLRSNQGLVSPQWSSLIGSLANLVSLARSISEVGESYVIYSLDKLPF